MTTSTFQESTICTKKILPMPPKNYFLDFKSQKTTEKA